MRGLSIAGSAAFEFVNIEKHSATSATLRAISPIVSYDVEFGFTPAGLIASNVGLNPTTPQNAAGRITDPPVCVPNASGTMSSPTAAAAPLEEPPGVCSGLRGLRVLPGVVIANSAVIVLPMITAPD